MKLSNNPDIALAQEWHEQLDHWIALQGLEGFDPFDIKEHGWVKAAQRRPLLRKTTTLICDLFPQATRNAFQVEPAKNPKTFALLALGWLRRYQSTGEERYLTEAEAALNWLLKHHADGFECLCWGYPFRHTGTGLDVPANIPNSVVSAIGGEAFLLAFEVTGNGEYLQAAQSIGQFILYGLPRVEEDGTFCFCYGPEDRRRVHNANLLAAAHLLSVWRYTQQEELLDTALRALKFTLNHQREDGAWPYGECGPEEPFEPAQFTLVDHHHTGFILRALHRIQHLYPRQPVAEALQKGFPFYKTLILPSGMPIGASRRYPVDIHACAEGILCPSVLSDGERSARELALRVLRWSWYAMRDANTGAPYYRKYPFFTSKIPYIRWGVAWMYRALAEYLYRFERG